MPFQRLPDNIRKHPDVQDTWHHHTAETLADHESRLRNLESGFHLSHMLNKSVKTPLGDLPLPIAIAGAGFTMWKYPDVVLKLFGQ